jgi:hypothetical protein
MRRTNVRTLTDSQEDLLDDIEKFWAGVADRRKLSRISVRIPRSTAKVVERILDVYPEINLQQLLQAAESYTARNQNAEQGNISGHHVLSSEKTMGEIAARIKTGNEAETLLDNEATRARMNALKTFLVSSLRQRKIRKMPTDRDILLLEAEHQGLLENLEPADVETAVTSILQP